jgi:hypothetical protein
MPAGEEVTFTPAKIEMTVPPPQVYDLVLQAGASTPNGTRIAADKAGVAVTDRGFIIVDIQLRTNVPHIQLASAAFNACVFPSVPNVFESRQINRKFHGYKNISEAPRCFDYRRIFRHWGSTGPLLCGCGARSGVGGAQR